MGAQVERLQVVAPGLLVCAGRSVGAAPPNQRRSSALLVAVRRVVVDQAVVFVDGIDEATHRAKRVCVCGADLRGQVFIAALSRLALGGLEERQPELAVFERDLCRVTKTGSQRERTLGALEDRD